MKDNEIIKALECCSKNLCTNECPGYHNDYIPCIYTREELMGKALDLINRLKAEIKKLKDRQKPTGASGYKIENGKVVFFTNMLGGYREEKENLEEVVKTLNELLQEAYAKDEIAFALKCKTEELKTAKAEARKEFADRLKENTYFLKDDEDFDCAVVFVSDIDNLLAEMESERE